MRNSEPDDEDDVLEVVAAQRRELTTLPDGLAPEAWERRSLCAGRRQTVTSSRSLHHLSVDLDGVEVRASDIDWLFGTGVPLSGTAQDLALVLCGRTLPAGRLDGAGGRFTAPGSGGAGPPERPGVSPS